jgi:hypothetical protein
MMRQLSQSVFLITAMGAGLFCFCGCDSTAIESGTNSDQGAVNGASLTSNQGPLHDPVQDNAAIPDRDGTQN